MSTTNTPFEESIRPIIGMALFGPKYYDYCLTPMTEPKGKYPYPAAIAELDRVIAQLTQLHRAAIVAELEDITLSDAEYQIKMRIEQYKKEGK